MATTDRSVKEVAAAGPSELKSHNRPWIIGFLVAAVGIFLLYHSLLPNLNTQVNANVSKWLPLTSVNEAMVWVICAVGLNIVVGYAGLLDLGYVAFWAIGGYTAGWLMSEFFFNVNVNVLGGGIPGTGGIHINFWIVLLVAGLFCALWGVIIGAPTLRLKSDYLAIVTLGFGEIIPQIFYNGDHLFGHNISNGIKGISPVDQIVLPGVLPGVPSRLGVFDLDYKFLVYVVIAAVAVFISLRIRTGRLGRAWLAIREDELAASMMGVPLMQTKLAAYAVGAFMGGLGGVAFTTQVNGIFVDRFNFQISIILLAMVVLGGMGNVWGVIMGALLLTWFNTTGLPNIVKSTDSWRPDSLSFGVISYLVFGLILVLMMLFRREGLFPETRTRQMLHEEERTEVESLHADLEEQ
jgi:branched-chain amino acid transport system permease protein